MVDIRSLAPVVHRDEEAIDQFGLSAGWRIFVTNAAEMTLNQSTHYYRDEWLVERGFHRFKRGHIPVLSLFLRLPERIKGLLLLTIALQVLTLMEFVSRKELAKKDETISGVMVEGLTFLQKQILSILQLPEKIYDLSFKHG